MYTVFVYGLKCMFMESKLRKTVDRYIGFLKNDGTITGFVIGVVFVHPNNWC